MVWTRQMDLSAYRQFLIDMMELQMWYAVHVVRTEGLSWAEALNHRTEVYAYSRHFDPAVTANGNREWRSVVERLELLWREMGDETFPAAAWTVLACEMEPRMADDLAKARAAVERSFAGFMYEFHSEYFGPSSPELVTLHFRNYFAPDTPFDHSSELREGLKKILNETHQQRPDVIRVQCATWLNNIPHFYQLFPPSWYETSVVCPLEGHTGWWGQLIDRTGRLHPQKAAHFRQTGVFPYPNRHCRCSIQELHNYLGSYLSDS